MYKNAHAAIRANPSQKQPKPKPERKEGEKPKRYDIIVHEINFFSSFVAEVQCHRSYMKLLQYSALLSNSLWGKEDLITIINWNKVCIVKQVSFFTSFFLQEFICISSFNIVIIVNNVSYKLRSILRHVVMLKKISFVHI